VSIGLYCALLAPQWKAHLRSTSVQIMNAWPLGYSITRLETQSRKFGPILIITGPKNDHFFACKRTGFVDQRLWDSAKMTLTRVSSHWLWLKSSRVILWKTWLESSRVTIFLTVTRVESESLKIVTRVESLTRVTLSLVTNNSRLRHQTLLEVVWSSVTI